MERAPEALGLSALSQPQRHERLARCASHHGSDAITLFKTDLNGSKRFGLMGTGPFAFGREGRTSKPLGNRLQVFLRQSFEIGSTNAVEAASSIHDRREVVTVSEEDTSADLIGQTHEGR